MVSGRLGGGNDMGGVTPTTGGRADIIGHVEGSPAIRRLVIILVYTLSNSTYKVFLEGKTAFPHAPAPTGVV